jgi:Adenylate and Guanylate cyclase catalytic domain
MIDREAGMPEDRWIRFRVGINLGDIIVEGDDIFGDGVNVAARLEALAEPGGLCISRTVREQIRDKLAYSFEDLGEQSVKNIARPVRVYALRFEAVADLPASSVTPVSQWPIRSAAGSERSGSRVRARGMCRREGQHGPGAGVAMRTGRAPRQRGKAASKSTARHRL